MASDCSFSALFSFMTFSYRFFSISFISHFGFFFLKYHSLLCCRCYAAHIITVEKLLRPPEQMLPTLICTVFSSPEDFYCFAEKSKDCSATASDVSLESYHKPYMNTRVHVFGLEFLSILLLSDQSVHDGM